MNRSARVSPGLLERIVAGKRAEVAALRARAAELRAAAEAAPAPVSLLGSLRGRGDVGVIAEVKRRSPSAGELAPGRSLVTQAAAYASGGAAAVSVLTESAHFGGSLADLEAVRSAVSLPLLRKDFTVDPVQVWEAKAAGAAAVLLIVRILDGTQLAELHGLAVSLGLTVLVEAHTSAEVERALGAGAALVGVNNRDLDTLTTDLAVTEQLAGQVPADCVLVGESGVRTRADVERLAAAGVDAVLVGESLLRGGNPAAGVRQLTGIPRRPRA